MRRDKNVIDKSSMTHDEYVEAILLRLQRQLVTRWVITVIGLLIVGAGISFTVAQNHNTASQSHSTAQKAQQAAQKANQVAVQAKSAVSEAASTAKAVSQERAAAIVNNCNDQNMRNVNTSARLLTELQDAAKANPTEKVRILASYQSTKLLINALAPHQDCKRLLHKETNLPKAKPGSP